MSTRLELARKYAARYRRAARKRERSRILDEFLSAAGYKSRKYAIRLLRNFDKTRVVCLHGKTVKLKPEKPKGQGNRAGKPLYDDETIECLKKIWAFYWYKCGKYLSPIIHEQIDDLQKSGEPDFNITGKIRDGLLSISPAQIDRRLKAEKDALKGRGISGTRLGEAALLKQIPIRTCYSNEERNIPGYCQMDTVHHCGNADSDEFCLTLTITEVASGWTFLFPLRNKAHSWVIDRIQQMLAITPFAVIEIHTDNGSEFINKDMINWRKTVWDLLHTRSRAQHKNDNAFAEQKNNAFVRNYIGYARFDTDAEFDALANAYTYLYPLINFFLPNKKLTSKTTVGSKTVKVYDKDLKTPYQRLMDSSLLTRQQKDKLAAQRALYNPVNLQHSVNKAVNALMAAHRAKTA